MMRAQNQLSRLTSCRISGLLYLTSEKQYALIISGYHYSMMIMLILKHFSSKTILGANRHQIEG